LLQRVAPLPRMPASMQRESVTITLPIEYSLTTN
jgi:protein TonB